MSCTSVLANKRSRSTSQVLSTLPRNGRIAWNSLSRPIFAEPPAESPSTRNNSLRARSVDSQSVSLPGNTATAEPFLFSTFCAARARACAWRITRSASLRPCSGCELSQNSSCGFTSDDTSRTASRLLSRSLICPWNCGSSTFAVNTKLARAKTSSGNSFKPFGSKPALLRNRRSNSSSGSTSVSKYFGFGQTVTRVPLVLPLAGSAFGFSVLPLSPLLARALRGALTSPSAKLIVCCLPSRHTVTSSRDDSALVTDTPTPCSPPENEYAPPARLSNLPPACRRVKTISSTGTFSSGCKPTGMPRPSSSTLMLPSVLTVTSMCWPNPDSSSSEALSMTSWTMCNGLSVRVYIPGRCLTGSRPFKTLIDASPYSEARTRPVVLTTISPARVPRICAHRIELELRLRFAACPGFPFRRMSSAALLSFHSTYATQLPTKRQQTHPIGGRRDFIHTECG